MNRVIIRRPIWLAWHPQRGRRCGIYREAEGGWFFGVGLGPLFASVGPGRPLP